MNELMHPEWVEGRRIWMDTPMRDLVQRIRYGDPVKGWEGDERLALYWHQPDRRFELWRLEDDGQYRLVCRSGEDMALDERIIDALVGMDRRRRTLGLHDEILAHNAGIEARRARTTEEWIAEEMAPRLRHGIMKEM